MICIIITLNKTYTQIRGDKLWMVKYVADICGIKSSSSNIISVCKGKRKSCGFVIINNKKDQLNLEICISNITDNDWTNRP